MLKFEGEASEKKKGKYKENPLLIIRKVFHQCQISKLKRQMNEAAEYQEMFDRNVTRKLLPQSESRGTLGWNHHADQPRP